MRHLNIFTNVKVNIHPCLYELNSETLIKLEQKQTKHEFLLLIQRLTVCFCIRIQLHVSVRVLLILKLAQEHNNNPQRKNSVRAMPILLFSISLNSLCGDTFGKVRTL